MRDGHLRIGNRHVVRLRGIIEVLLPHEPHKLLKWYPYDR